MKTRLVMLFLLAIGALAILAVASSAQTAPPASGDWVVTDSTSYSNTMITVNGNITITGSSAMFSLQNVDLVINSSVPATITFDMGIFMGRLQDCRVSATDKPYTVVVYDKAYLFNTTFSDLISIEVNDFGPSIWSCTLVDPSGIGINFYPYMSTKMQRTSFRGNRITGFQDKGIQVILYSMPSGALDLVMDNNNITGTEGTGIWVYIYDKAAGVVNLTGCRVSGTVEYGIHVYSGGPSVDFSNIDVSGATTMGFSLNYSDTAPAGQVVRGVKATDNYSGVEIYMPVPVRWQRPRFVDWDVSNNGIMGIYLQGLYCATLEDSRALNNGLNDIYAEDTTLDLYDTVVTDLGMGYRNIGVWENRLDANVFSWQTVRLLATWQNDMPVEGRPLELRDDAGDVAASDKTHINGSFGPYLVWDWSVRMAGPFTRTTLRPFLVWNGPSILARDGAITFDGPIDETVVFVDDVVPVFEGLEGTFWAWINYTTFGAGVKCTDALSGVAIVQASIDPEPDWDLKVWKDAVLEGEFYNATFTGLSEGTYRNVPFWRAFDLANFPVGGYAQGYMEGWLYVDLTPPRVTVTNPVISPSEPYFTNRIYLDINGTVEDDVEVYNVYINGIPVEPILGFFSHRVPLFEGENVFTVTGQDRAGNWGEDVVLRVYLDTVEPQLRIVGPVDGTRTNLSEIEVYGVTEPSGARVVVAGVEATLVDTDWTATVPLVAGTNEILVEAFDRAGNRNWATVEVLVDGRAPRVSIESPTRGALFNTAIVELTCFIEEEDYLEKFTINGVEYPFVALPGMGAGLSNEPLGPFPDGEATILVEATDVSGNVGRMTVVVTIDTTPPALSEISVANGTATNQRHLPLTGRTEWDATLLLGGRSVAVESGAFSTTLDLREGWNVITLAVTDLAGNTGSFVLHVLLDTLAPELIIDFVTGPEVTVGDDVYELVGRTEPLARLVVEVDGVEYEVAVRPDGIFTRVVAVQSPRTVVNVTATDQVGNSNRTMLTLVRAVPAPPTPWTESPAAVGGAAAVTVLIALGVAASIETTKYSLLLLIIPLYARIKRDAVLDNKTRYALHGLIIENPGLHYNAVIREFGLTNGEAAYHLSVLEREGFIRSVRDGTLRKFYSTTSKVPSPKRMTPEELRERILDLVDGFPGISQKQIVDELGIGRTLAGYHLKNLLVEGYVDTRHEGRFTLYYPTRKRREGIAQRARDPQASNGWELQ